MKRLRRPAIVRSISGNWGMLQPINETKLLRFRITRYCQHLHKGDPVTFVLDRGAVIYQACHVRKDTRKPAPLLRVNFKKRALMEVIKNDD